MTPTQQDEERELIKQENLAQSKKILMEQATLPLSVGLPLSPRQKELAREMWDEGTRDDSSDSSENENS